MVPKVAWDCHLDGFGQDSMWSSMSTLPVWTSNSYEVEAGSLSRDIAKLDSGCGSMAFRDVTNTVGS